MDIDSTISYGAKFGLEMFCLKIRLVLIVFSIFFIVFSIFLIDFPVF